MRRSGVRIPLAPPQTDIRLRVSVFCMPVSGVAVPGCRVACGAAGVPGAGCALSGRAAWCARGRRPARETTRCELRSARRLEARPGPATAHGHRSLALRSLRRPPHRRRLRCCVADVPGQDPLPPTGTAAWPSGALRSGEAWSLTCCSVRRLEARSGPATAQRCGRRLA